MLKTEEEDQSSLHLRGAVLEILQNVSKKDGITTSKRLAYLNSFVNYLRGTGIREKINHNLQSFCVTIHDICICLRACLSLEATVTRAATLRVFRYLITSEDDVKAIIATSIPSLVVRSLDIMLNNTGERLQALRFCQKLLSIPSGVQHFPLSITRSLIAIAFDGLNERDRLHRGSLSLLCQLSVLAPLVFIECGGVRVLLHNLLSCPCPMIIEALVASLLYLLNTREIRVIAALNIHFLLAPLTDVHFKHGGPEGPSDTDEREIGYRCSQLAIASVLHSWNGMLHFCQGSKSGLRSLIQALRIEQLEIRKTILDLISDIVGLKFTKWTDEVTVALSTLDPSKPKESWSLQEGFVVEEALAVLPHLASSTPNITTNHTALLMSLFVRDGLFDALVEVIITSDTFISVRATVLLGELLSLADRLIPSECFDASQCVPSLIRLAISPDLLNSRHLNERLSSPAVATSHLKQQRAMEAVTILSALHRIKARSPVASSVFLQMQVSRSCLSRSQQYSFVDRLGEVQLTRILRKNLESNTSKLLKETFVLNSKDPFTWQWETICTILKWRPEQLKKIDDSSWRAFLRKLIDFFKPSTNTFARVQLGNEHASLFVHAGCSFVELLSEDFQNFGTSLLLDEFLEDLVMQLDNLLNRVDNPGEANWNPVRLETTLTQTYFLFIGKLTESSNGFRFLERAEIPRKLVHLINKAQHEHYIKLIISSLSYNDDFSRMVIKSALTSLYTPCRLYATKFLRVLIRVKPPEFSKWGIELLVQQLSDENSRVALHALEVLEEAIHDKMFLESLIAIRPTLTLLGDRGLLLLVCFLSLPSGYKYLNETNFLRTEIEKWKNTFNKRYVEIVEVLVRDSISTLRRGDDGFYPVRKSKKQDQVQLSDLYMPPHLYGQLAKHKNGLDMLIQLGGLNSLIDTVLERKCKTPTQTVELKAALWALSHLSVAEEALPLLQDSHVLQTMIILASECSVLSVRHTVFHCLCIISSTSAGADVVRRYGWHTMRRTHHEIYPVWDSLGFVDGILEDVQLCENEKFDTVESESVISVPIEVFENNDSKKLSSSSGMEILDDSRRTLNYSDISSNQAECEMNLQDITRGLNQDKLISGNIKTKLEDKAISYGGKIHLEDENSRFHIPKEEAVIDFQNIPSKCELSTSEDQDITCRHSSNNTESNGVLGLSDLPEQRSQEFDNFGALSGTPASLSKRTHHSLPCSLQDMHPSSLPSEAVSTITESLNPGPRSVLHIAGSTSVTKIPQCDVDQTYQFQHNRMSLRWKQSSKLEHKFDLTPKDLFDSSKLKRFGSSMTSLSTQSIRSQPEGNTKGPCYMGLCLPRDFTLLLVTEEHQFLKAMSVLESGSQLSTDEDRLGDSSKIKCQTNKENNAVIREMLRIATNLISSVGVGSNEQSLLSLKQMYPYIFQSQFAYSEICDLLSQHNLRLSTRRFLQELFFDLRFEYFHQEAIYVQQKIRDYLQLDSMDESSGTAYFASQPN